MMNIYRCSDQEQNPISQWFSERNAAPAVEQTVESMQEEFVPEGFFPSFYRPSDIR